MKCQFCDQKATVFLTQVTDGEIQKISLCNSCAESKGVTDPTGFALADQVLAQLKSSAGFQPKSMKDRQKACSSCNFTLQDLKQVRRFGCPDCYTTFEEEVKQLIEGMHRGSVHVGHAPSDEALAKQIREQRIQDLQSKLSSAIESENYEEAASLRDAMLSLD